MAAMQRRQREPRRTGSVDFLPLSLLFQSSGSLVHAVAVFKNLEIELSSHLIPLSTPRLPTFGPCEPRGQLHIK